MRTLAIALCFLLAAAAAQAATYQWTDKKGGLHFTDNPDRIPAEYRQKAREIAVEPLTPLKFVEPEAAEAGSTTPPSGAGAEGLYCGKTGQSWELRYRRLRQERQQLAESLPEIEEELLLRHNRLQRSLWDYRHQGATKDDKSVAPRVSSGIYGRPSANRKDYQETYDNREKATARLSEVDQQLEMLEIEAARCSVPLEHRK